MARKRSGWRGPQEPGEFPTLGWAVGEWIEAFCVIPDGAHMGEPFLLTDEQWRFLLWHYRLKPDARVDVDKPSAPFRYRRSQLRRPQKWGKGPFVGGAVTCAEAEGPVLFDGWDANGEPVGRPWPTPWIQITAVSEDQTDNVWRALLPMIQLGPLADIITDTGETRINLASGGLIEPVTASQLSRLGQRVTFVVQDQTESWYAANGGHRLADNQRRNLGGVGGRSIETPNAWDPNERSVAQRTCDAAAADVYIDSGAQPKGDFSKKRDRTRILKQAYGDAWWIDLDRIEAECVELIAAGELSQAERWFGNRIVAGAAAAFDPEQWATLERRAFVPDDDEPITIGVDGARYDDALAIIATHVASGHQWPLDIQERPEHADDDYEHDFEQADQAMLDAFDRWGVWRVYIDPQRIETLVERWRGRWGEHRVVEWFTYRLRPMAFALRAYRDAQTGADLSHDGDQRFAAHISNARRRPTPTIRDDDGRPMWVIGKERDGSPLKIDAAMAGCLSWEARGDAIAAGVLKPKRRKRGHTF